jgi:hypothetical protein
MKKLVGLFRAVTKKLAWRQVKVPTRKSQDDSEIELAETEYRSNPDAIQSVQRFVAAILDSGGALPDGLQERALRLQLNENPHDFGLTYSLIALLCRLGRPPIPDQIGAMPAQGACADKELINLLQLADQYACEGDTFGVYAALWQTVVRFPGSMRGWAEFARAFANRAEWEHCRLALRRVFAQRGETTTVDVSLQALGTLAESKELGDLPWKEWVRANVECETTPGAVQLWLRAGDPARAATLSPKIIDRHPLRADAWLSAAKVEFEFDRLSNCYEFFHRALELDPRGSLQAIIRDFSSQFSGAVQNLGKEDELADWIAGLPGYDDINLIPPHPTPESLRATRNLRATATARGLPSAFLITQAKSASVSVGNIFSSGFELPTVLYSIANVRVVASWLDNFLLGGASYVTHLNPTERNIDLLHRGKANNILVHVRDPRQQIISLLNHYRRYPEQLGRSERGTLTQDNEQESFWRVMHNIFVPNTIGWIDGWYKAREKLSLNFSTFEEFVRDRREFTERLVAIYGGDTRYFNAANALTDHAGIDYHKRLGVIDEWRSVLNRKQIDEINRLIPSYFWSAFGWTP